MMKRLLLSALTILFAWQLLAQEESAAQLVDKGLNAERLGLMERAEGYYRQALAYSDDDALRAAEHLGILLEQKEYLD